MRIDCYLNFNEHITKTAFDCMFNHAVDIFSVSLIEGLNGVVAFTVNG